MYRKSKQYSFHKQYHLLFFSIGHYCHCIALFYDELWHEKIGSNNVAIITSVGPVSTILQAHFILGEKIFFLQVAGTVLVLIGVLLIGKQSNK